MYFVCVRVCDLNLTNLSFLKPLSFESVSNPRVRERTEEKRGRRPRRKEEKVSSSESGTHQSACRPAVSLNAAMLISLHSSQQTLITATRSALVTLTFTNELLKLRPRDVGGA